MTANLSNQVTDEALALIRRMCWGGDVEIGQATDAWRTLEAHLGSIEEQLQSQQEWIDRVAEFSTDAATAADKAEREVESLKEQVEFLQNIEPVAALRGRVTELEEQLETLRLENSLALELMTEAQRLEFHETCHARNAYPASEPHDG